LARSRRPTVNSSGRYLLRTSEVLQPSKLGEIGRDPRIGAINVP
jgi:hypothetical protein